MLLHALARAVVAPPCCWQRRIAPDGAPRVPPGQVSLELDPCSQGATSCCCTENPLAELRWEGRETPHSPTAGPSPEAFGRARSPQLNLPIQNTAYAQQEPQLRELSPLCSVQSPGGRSHPWVTP